MPRIGEPYGHTWQRVRLEVLERDEYLCQIRREGCTVTATQVDHIVPWRAGGSLYDPAGLRAACRFCNLARVWRGSTRRPSREW